MDFFHILQSVIHSVGEASEGSQGLAQLWGFQVDFLSQPLNQKFNKISKINLQQINACKTEQIRFLRILRKKIFVDFKNRKYIRIVIL